MIWLKRRFSPVLQTTASECGLACLVMIANYHGKFIELFELRSQFVTSLRGMTMAAMVRIAKSVGLAARALKVEVEHADRLSLPCVLHWDMNHFVVLVKASKSAFTIYDPGNGERKLTRTEFGKHFTGVALELFPAPDFKPEEPKPKASWRDLMGNVVGLYRSAAQLIALSVALQIIGMIIPWVSQWVMDGVIVSGDYSLLTVLMIGFIILMFVQVLVSVARSWYGLILATQINVQWSGRVMGHMLRLPATYFETRHVGDIVSRFRSLGSIQSTVTSVMTDTVLDGVFAVATLAMMFVYSPALAVCILLALAIYAICRLGSYRTFRLANAEYLVLAASEQSHFLESVRGYQSIKIGCLEEKRRARWMNLLVASINRSVTTAKMSIGFGATYSVLFGLEQLVVMWLGASAVINGNLSVGMLLAFMSYRDQFSSRMKALIDKFIELKLLDLQLERLGDIVMTPSEVTDGVCPIDLLEGEDAVGAEPSRIEFKNVSFRYGSGEKWVFRNLSFAIEAREHVAIVGASGSGKSTIAKLILGLLEPVEGDIHVDGRSLKQLGLENWRKRVGVVMQDDQLFSGTIVDNISRFDTKIDETKVEKVANIASVHDDITDMPMGYRTFIGDMGSSLSGGQKQRLLLARALYGGPSILVLDEATSHLDVTNEKNVSSKISDLKMTRVVIAHRPETIAMAGRVIDLDQLKALAKVQLEQVTDAVKAA